MVALEALVLEMPDRGSGPRIAGGNALVKVKPGAKGRRRPGKAFVPEPGEGADGQGHDSSRAFELRDQRLECLLEIE